jgi:hypothetical protein
VTAAIFRSNIPNFRSLKYPIIAPAEIGEIISHAGDGVSGAAEWQRSRRQPTIDRYSRCATHYECRTSSLTRGRGRSISRLKARVAPMSFHMLIGEACHRGSMTKYRMGIFKPGHKLGLPAPCCGNDATFSLLTMLPRQLRPRICIALTRLSGSQTSFHLCDSSGRSIYKSIGNRPK